ncbi:hypothetical protein P7K49_012226, partial [Saguinus oedipus]
STTEGCGRSTRLISGITAVLSPVYYGGLRPLHPPHQWNHCSDGVQFTIEGYGHSTPLISGITAVMESSPLWRAAAAPPPSSVESLQ